MTGGANYQSSLVITRAVAEDAIKAQTWQAYEHTASYCYYRGNVFDTALFYYRATTQVRLVIRNKCRAKDQSCAVC